jgi:hypothetical protein
VPHEYSVSPRRMPRTFAAVAVLLVLALVSSLSLAGTHFYYCEAMGLTRSDPCQASGEAISTRNTAPAIGESHTDCCKRVTLASLPIGARAADRGVAPSPLEAIVVPAAFVQSQRATEVRALSSGFERWRPPRRPASEVRAQLMVFLT